MSTTFRLIGTLLLCGILSGCETKVEVKGPTPPPAPGPAPSATPKAAEAPVLTMPKLDGPKIGPPSAGPSLLPTDLPPAVGNAPTPSSPAANPDKRKLADDLKVVQSVIANVMKIKVEDVAPTKTLAELKVSTLELADIRVELGSRLKVDVTNQAMQKAAGVDGSYELAEKLTVNQLAEIVNSAPAPKAP